MEYEERNFSGAVWHHQEFEHESFRHAILDYAEIRHCRFVHCDFTGVSLKSAVIKDSMFVACEWKWALLFGASLVDLKMTGGVFDEADLRGAVIRGGNWSASRLRNQYLRQQDFSGMSWKDADFYRADLRDCNFTHADLTRVMLTQAKLAGADLRGAEIGGIDWKVVDLTQVKVDSAQAILIARSFGAQVID